MSRIDFLGLASNGLRMPVGTDLVLHEHTDRQAILLDGRRLGEVVLEASEKYGTPLAFPLMDLVVEKAAIASAFGVPPSESDAWHLSDRVSEEEIKRTVEILSSNPTQRMTANCDALKFVAASEKRAVGMSIGPFSLMTKLVVDPITAVYLAGMGTTADEDPDVALIESALSLAEAVIEVSLKAQIAAGAEAVFVCEPAANIAYFSPIQLESDSSVFQRYVLGPNRRLKAILDNAGVDLIFHDCGELTNDIVTWFGEMHPAVLSLGSSRVLWEDAKLLPKDVVLYGNLPSKRFYSDELLTVDQVRGIAEDLYAKMRATGHPFILGSECDVLAVPGCEDSINAKVRAMISVWDGTQPGSASPEL